MPAPRSCRSRRSPTRRPTRRPMPSICRAAIPSCTPARSPRKRSFLDGLRASAARGAFVYGECGGFMVLGEALVDRAGEAHRMAGLLPVTTSFAEPRRHLGYRRLKLLAPSPLGQAGTTFRGHEFHYASLARGRRGRAAPLFEATDARHQPLGPLGACQGAVAGSFMHLIDRTTEPETTRPRPNHLRVVDD